MTYKAIFEEIPFQTVRVAANDYSLGNVYVDVPDVSDYTSRDNNEAINISVREGTTIYIEAYTDNEYYDKFPLGSIKWIDTNTQEEHTATMDIDSYERFVDKKTIRYQSYHFEIEVTSDLDFTAIFEEADFYTTRVIANPVSGGDVWTWTKSGDDPFDEGGEWDDESTWDYWITVRENTEVTIYASALDGYRFLGWYDGDMQIYGPEYNNQYISFTPTESKTYTARFEEIPKYNVHIAANDYDLGEVFVYDDYSIDYSSYETNDAIDFEVVEGTTLTIGADPFNEYFIELAKWSDGSTSRLFSTTVTSDINLTAEFKEKEHPTPETGYTQLGDSKLYYATSEYSIDIHGAYNQQFYQSTYGNYGYQAAIKVGENSAQMIPGSGTASYNGVQVETSIQQQNKYARIIYTVTNSSNAAKTVSLGAYADVQIGENDAAPIQTRTVGGNVFGLTMDDGTGSQFCVLFGAGISGVAPISDYWFGSYGYNRDAEQIAGSYTTDVEHFMEQNGSYDSAMGWCWKNRTIGAGETMVFSYLIAVGDISIEPNSNITVTSNDMTKWNDLSAVQSLFVEGMYDGVLNGTIEYRVEDSEEWLTLAEDVASGAVFYKSINVQFDATKQTHILRFRTRDMMDNISGETTFAFQDISAYGVTGGIEDKVYTGDPIEQMGLTSDLADESLYQYTYINNIDAGTATLYFEGVFPYSIGRRVYTFKIAPQELTGTISPNTSSRTYTGSEIKTGWHFSNEAYYGTHALQADKDFTVTYTDNILPGIATITVTGKGNYKGTLTTTFEIKKMPLESSLWAVTLPESNILYDGQKHDASITTLADGMGTAEVVTINRVTGETAEPMEKGIYDMYVRIVEGALYYGTSEDLYVGTTTIYELDDTDWAALQNIYNELITRGWNNPWDMSKGKAGIASMAGITLTQGHVTGLDLSNSNLTGTFPTSILYLPYLETLDLSGNQLSGDIEDGLDAYTAWAAEQQTDEKETIDVYVQKPTSWSSARIWAWTGYGSTTHNLFDEWPGVEMTETANGWWKYSGLPKGVSVVLNDYYHTGEQSMDVPDNGSEAGGLQSDTWIVMTNEMVNNSSVYSYGYAANWWSDPTKGLRHINIANNAFTGNIGAFAALFPELVTLDAQANRIEEVAPMISTKITSLNIKNQTIATTRTIDMRKSQTMSDLMALIPSVMTYNHTAQTYSLNGTLKIENSLTEPTWDAQLTVSNGQVTLASATGNEFRFGAEDVLYAVESSTGSSFPVSILFNEGDANFDGAVDVIDLQTMINHIFGKNSASRPFNFTAANLYKDEVINIQDIVLQVNLLLQAQAEEQSVGRRMTPADEHTEAATARLTWRNGELHLFSEEPVASMDLTINSESEIEWHIPSHTVRSVDSGQNHKAIVYSLGGKTLPAGTDIIIARSKAVAVETVSATLSNSDAERIPVQLLTEYVGVPTATDDVEGAEIHVSVVNNTVVLTTDEPLQNVNWTLYDFTGKAITGGVVNTTGGTSQLTSGIPTGTYMFVLREQTGKVINIQKTILK
ncbi:MAG: starch-binding protein [Paludibacteraceae bacterium]|nr:starch-binding protein [Paludibacteraceae bacterium]